MQAKLMALRAQLAALEQRVPAGNAPEHFSVGFPGMDAVLGGGLARAGLHEIFAERVADAGAAAGFTLGLALRAAHQARAIVWVRQIYARCETGTLYAPGLRAFGCTPDKVILIELHSPLDVLRAGLEAARCPALGALIIEPWGNPKALNFTATRRMGLAAASSGIPVFLLRIGAAAHHSAAQTRWQVTASASRPLAANAPGVPAFNVSLLRHRTGAGGQVWCVEWDHEQLVFRQSANDTALSRPVVSLSDRRPASAPTQDVQPFPIARAQ